MPRIEIDPLRNQAKLNIMDLEPTREEVYEHSKFEAQPGPEPEASRQKAMTSPAVDTSYPDLSKLDMNKVRHLAVRWENFKYGTDVIYDLLETLTPGFMLEAKESAESAFDEINKPFKPIEDDINTLLRDIFPDAIAWFEESDDPRGIWETIVHFRWLFNFFYVGVPWVFFSLLLGAGNLTFNIVLNRDWADGNVWLIFNTVYLLVQIGFSWPLVIELPIYMYTFRLFRIMSVFAAGVYNFFYILCTLDWIYQIYWEPTKAFEEYQFVDILLNMFLAYNIVFNLLIVPVNWMIIGKEVSMFISPMLDQDEGDQLDNEDIIDAIAPQTWWKWLAYGETPDQQMPDISKPDQTNDPYHIYKDQVNWSKIKMPPGYKLNSMAPIPESVMKQIEDQLAQNKLDQLNGPSEEQIVDGEILIAQQDLEKYKDNAVDADAISKYIAQLKQKKAMIHKVYADMAARNAAAAKPAQ